jgi:hypothetical protein
MNMRTAAIPTRHNTNVRWASRSVRELIFRPSGSSDQMNIDGEIYVPIWAAYNMRNCATNKLTL